MSVAILMATLLYVAITLLREPHSKCEHPECDSCPFPKCKGCDR